MSDTSRPRASLRTAVVWEVLKEALDRRVKATGRDVLDVLDTGGGTGKFAVPVARLGHRVTVVDPSPNALFGLERRVSEAGVADLVRGVQGDAQGLLDVVERDAYDVVLCHGVLEYVDDPAEGVANAFAALRSGGVLSLLAAGLGGAVLARALAGHFTEARTALTDPAGRWGTGDPVPRRFTAEQLTELVGGAGLEVGTVHGVRIFADLVPGVLVDTEPGAVEALLRLEEAAAELPAFHAVATQLHVLGEKPA
ncbi:methyltransferase domain-containing protein [Streptomyces goshikiensis]|uniref:Methyltransferase domain-containing protein n=1 Tax=Streptomyces goshikiensis TaxID=1942 RepID=A0ABZ1RQM2_9ACTN|nr:MULTISPECIES: methyltransferase [Streptomyces]AKL65801.1 methyltransferase type 12 [Streptomyces sp. Mg1]EDX22479.1 methyltransferase [Streptomyces sp. Mg1]MBP0933904.1 methyltransferase domain-containing protein [Streptomyces sp. KCTC 0041BP]OKI27522.1 methyltransferase type 12 [Streptomyces sp. CB03578]PJN15264.1 SAM-dependent methyltransferase [Streptomyces sp. CB02120-2]